MAIISTTGTEERVQTKAPAFAYINATNAELPRKATAKSSKLRTFWLTLREFWLTLRETTFRYLKRSTPEIALALALALAVVAAIPLEYYSKESSRKILRRNSEATAKILAFTSDGKQHSSGSGVFLTSNGVLLTNYHLIEGIINNSKEILFAHFPSGANYIYQGPIGLSKDYDVALLKFDAHNLPHVSLGDSTRLLRGEKVFAMGSPRGLPQTVSKGIIRYPVRILNGKEFIQFTSSISPGSPGGGLYNKQGKVIGLTTRSLVLPPSVTHQRATQNLNFAIPAHVLAKALRTKDNPLTEESPDYFYSLGMLAENKKKYEDAIDCFKKAIELNGRYANAYVELGNVYYEKGLYDLEIQTLEKAAQLVTEDKDIYFYLGFAYENKGSYDRAMDAYIKVLALDPNDKAALDKLAILYIVNYRRREANQIFLKLQKLNPGIANKLIVLLNKSRFDLPPVRFRRMATLP